MTKEIHFFENLDTEDDWVLHGTMEDKDIWTANDYFRMDYLRNEMPYENAIQIIVTTQMCFLSTDWFEEGFRVFVHDHTGTFEIVLGDGNERTSRYIRYAHDLFKLWRNGEFGLREEKE